MAKVDNCFETYLKKVTGDKNEMRLNVKNFMEEVESQSRKEKRFTSLVFGHVQSGKTAQMLGILCRLQDEGYKNFVILTSSNSMLLQQTYDRCKSVLVQTQVYKEDEFESF